MALGTEIALIKALGGGASLPSVTSADVGKVLGVNDSGVWVAANPSGGDGNIFIVNATFAFDSVEEEWSVTLDKTFAEISASANAGKIVLCIPYESASGATGYPCVMTVESIESFANTDVEAGNDAVYSFSFGIDSNDDTYVDATTWSKSGGGVLAVTATTEGNTTTLDKTWQEINDADFAVIKDGQTRRFVANASYQEPIGNYLVVDSSNISYTADSASGYPSHTGK